MIIVIDGYNVIKPLVAAHTKGNKERNLFIAQLGIYAKRKKHTILVVFDGGQHEWPYSEHSAGIQVVYSGARQSADEYISSYLKKQKQGEIVLVSSDHALSSFASDCGIPSIDSVQFYAILQETVYGGQKRKDNEDKPRRDNSYVKLHNDTSPEFDAYMEAASENIKIKPADAPISTVENARNKLPRKDRSLLKIFKKL